jgi:hypothetical protein
MQQYPKQANGIEINKVADGYVVYQPDRERVHYLNHTAAIVLELCDGQIAADSMSQIIQDVYQLPALPETEVAECLKKLFDEELIK